MSSISKSQREQISKILKERIAFGRQKVVEIRASLTQPSESVEDNELATRAEEHALMFVEIRRLNEDVERCIRALQRGEDIGYCDSCGDDVTFERLSINPAAIRCVGCETLEDHRAKHYRAA
ncbi:TPA: TraR/DksA C4-type zinc finger protein [Aeromonas veronii]|nr:TraR/DksA C4-type zinc finger protein [Aeromonas veronii]